MTWLRFSIALGALLVAMAEPVHAAEPPALANGLYAEIITPRGTVVCELFYDKVPLTVASFVGLAEGTLGPAPRRPFFDGLTFHRVVPDFVVQGGDPLGNGDGGPGYTFADEFVPGLRHDAAGVLSMANDGPDTNGSQFFITLRETNRLNYLHSVFGRTVRGLEVLPKIQQGDAMTVRIIRIGTAARGFATNEPAFSQRAAAARKYSGQKTPGADANFDDPDGLLPTDPPRAKNFNYKLANLERATGMRIVARLLAKTPPDNLLRDLAVRLGVAKTGALALYVAERDEWKLWLGDDSAARFMGRAGAVRDFMQDGAFHEAKQGLLDAARKQGEADYAAQVKTAPVGSPPSLGQRLKLQTDAVLDRLIFKLEPQ